MLHPSRPTFRMPRGAWDTHVHVYGPVHRFPFTEPRTYTPDDAPAERLQQLHRLLGVERVVFVQATVHGFDNSAMLDAIARDPGAHRGVALVPTDVGRAELDRLHAGGVRGVRFNFARHLGQAPDRDAVSRLADRIAPLGWHLQFYMDGADLADNQRFLEHLPVPFVIDHFGRVKVADGLDAAPMRVLLELVRQPHGWVKISGPERISAALSASTVPYADTVPFARRLLDVAPDRVLWGSDWPHPNVPEIPDDGKLVDLLAHHTDDARLLQRVLVDNPTRLYASI
jgi:predicted TIM-barrel fold metal-dependent hydrolase